MSAGSKKSEDTTKKLHRLLTILRMLDNRERCTPETLASRFGTTERNIYRDMRDLDTAGFAITFNRDNNTYGFTDPDFFLRDLNLNKEELLALKEEIEIVYKAMKNMKETKRDIAPYGLFFYDGIWYVLGYCNLRKEIRTFALDCIKEYKITGKSYNIPSIIRGTPYLSHSF